MKKTCSGCRALLHVQASEFRCELGHPIKEAKVNLRLGWGGSERIPTEECSKPKTYRDYQEALYQAKKKHPKED